MKRMLAIFLTAAVLLGLCGCNHPSAEESNGGTTASTGTTTTGDGSTVTTTTTAAPQDDSYDRAVAAIGRGEIGEAFRLLSSSSDERAAELLLHFVWQPLWSAGENPGSHTYDASGYPATSVWGNRTTTFTWDAEGRLLKQHTDEDSATHYWEQYDYTYEGGLLTKRIRTHLDGNGETETFTYDGNGNRIGWNYDSSYDPDDYTKTYTYDGDGHLLTHSVSKPDGYQSTVTYTYNAAGQLLSKTSTYNDGRATETLTRTYNERGQKLTETNVLSYGTSIHTYTYGERGELISDQSEWVGETPMVKWCLYDEFGRYTGMILERDGEEINNHTVEYDDETDSCLFVGGGSIVQYQLFYYPQEPGRDLVLNAATWIEYFDWQLQ